MFKNTVLSGVRSNWKRAWNGNLTTLDSKYRTDGRSLVVASALKPKQLEIVSRPNEKRNNGVDDQGCEQVIPDIYNGYERVHPREVEKVKGLTLATFEAELSKINTRLDADVLVTLSKATGITKVYARDATTACILHNDNDEFVGVIMPVRKD